MSYCTPEWNTGITKRFLWKRTTLNDVTKWLVWGYIYQEYNNGWHDVSWSTKEDYEYFMDVIDGYV